MPNRETIAREITLLKAAGQDTIRRKYLKELADYTGTDTIVYFCSYHIKRSVNYVCME